MLAHIHPSRLWFTCETRPIFNDTAYPGPESGAGQGPPVWEERDALKFLSFFPYSTRQLVAVGLLVTKHPRSGE